MDKPRRITLNDIAHACGVSRATVSLVLRRSPLVHADTRRRVEAEMQRQGYVYNRAAANLRQRVSTTVALIINDLSNPFFAEFAAGVDEALGAKGYVTLLGSSNESPARQRQLLGSMVEHHPAGIILSPAENSDVADVELAIGRHAPLLVFNRELTGAPVPGFEYDFVGLDNRAGAHAATKRLLELGHRHIAFYGGHADSSSCRGRRLGYQDALREAGITADPRWMIETTPTRLEASAHADALFAIDPAPTAAVCYNDAVALGLMLGLTRLGRHPGVDFAVTGFDNIPEAAVGVPPLTTLDADPRARGRQVAELVLQRAATPSMPRRSVIVPVLLTERESTPRALHI
ncbi:MULTISPECIES: LacI family DNA-binding transcriptional regulator [unclassified Pseudoxanthomonas]|uniref:LacI family DNA-binding transcriptional regulator n=1 Tax=unclassified Pseudoxanthomonas TaxID=2645906 RepID=UPI0030772CDD